MLVDIFDDLFSIGHFIAGLAAYWIPWLSIGFFCYEFIEHCLVNRRWRKRYSAKFKGIEPQRNFLGDLMEFLIGVAAMHFIWLLL